MAAFRERREHKTILDFSLCQIVRPDLGKAHFRSASEGTAWAIYKGYIRTYDMQSPVMRFAPTYRLESQNPFNSEMAEIAIKSVLDHFLDGTSYNSKSAPNLCKGISEEVKSRIKLQKPDRYKLICVVTIGEKRFQGFSESMTFLWDAKRDYYVSYVYDRPNIFAIGTVYAIYYD